MRSRSAFAALYGNDLQLASAWRSSVLLKCVGRSARKGINLIDRPPITVFWNGCLNEFHAGLA